MREENRDEFNSQNSPHTHKYADTLARSEVSSLESYVGEGASLHPPFFPPLLLYFMSVTL